jgi:hypothetical protein
MDTTTEYMKSADREDEFRKEEEEEEHTGFATFCLNRRDEDGYIFSNKASTFCCDSKYNDQFKSK